MKTKTIGANIVLFAIVSYAFAADHDPRVEGFWTGVETFQIPANFMQKGEAPVQKAVFFAIGDSGKIIAVVHGFDPGRYEVVLTKSSSDTLNFRAFTKPAGLNPSMHIGRAEGRLVISPDGNTLTEKGFALLPGTSIPVGCHITAVLHRKTKK